jgi:hypoxanthine phosphoribosyltransferase
MFMSNYGIAQYRIKPLYRIWLMNKTARIYCDLQIVLELEEKENYIFRQNLPPHFKENMPDKELVITQTAIAERVKELGAAITKDYDKGQLLVVGILNGAFMFMADLVREIKREMEIDFVRVASYGMGTTSGTLRFTKGIELDIQGRDILIVEDIIDTGRTLAYLRQSLEDSGALSVRCCALIDKKERREIDIPLDYVGFEVQSGFLVGYGLDCREKYRQLKEVYNLLEN